MKGRIFLSLGLLSFVVFAGDDIGKWDPNLAEKTAVVTNGMKWIDGRNMPLEGRAFDDTATYFERLPAGVTTNVNGGVRGMKRHTAGLQLRFRTDSPRICLEWTPDGNPKSFPHMAQTGIDGIDVYHFDEGERRWKYLHTGIIWDASKPGMMTLEWFPNHACLVHLPLYNGLKDLKVGILPHCSVKPLGPRASGIDKPVVFYGTSITHGGCASRPGMAFVNIIGRELDVPVVNLGFSGSGWMEYEMSEHLAKIDASCYVLDCLSNMCAKRDEDKVRHRSVEENYERFVRNLRAKRPDVPIVLAEVCDVYVKGPNEKDRMIRALYEKLVAEGWMHLVYLPKDGMFSGDLDGTVDGIHPNDLGMRTMADAYGRAVAEALSSTAATPAPEGTSFIPSVGEPPRAEPIVPFDFDAAGDFETGVRELKKLNREYGIKRVFICSFPGMKVKLSGFPKFADYTAFGEKLKAIREAVEPLGMKVGWWCAPSIQCGVGAPYQHIVAADGRVSTAGLCPLDPAWRDEFARRVAEVVRIGRPAAVIFEDDFELSNHPCEKGWTGMGCYCPLHLADFARRSGRTMTREELAEMETKPECATLDLRRKLAASRIESLVGCARRVREEVDKVAPDTPIGNCSTGVDRWDGGITEAMSRALAGSRCRPFVRLPGSIYNCFSSPGACAGSTGLSKKLFETLPKDVYTMHEADTFPHTSYYMPASYLQAMVFGTAAMGAMDELFYGTQYLDDPLEGGGYFKSFLRYRDQLKAYRLAIAGAPLDGVQTFHSDDSENLRRDIRGHGHRYHLPQFGIPTTYLERPVKFVFGKVLADVPDEEIRALLEKGGVILDANTAVEVGRRGLGELIGADVSLERLVKASGERILPAAGVTRIAGRNMYNYGYLFGPGAHEYSENATVSNLRPGAVPLVDYTGPDGQSLSPSVYRYRNAAGGEIGVVAVNMIENYASSWRNSRKREVLRLLVERMNGGPISAQVADEPNAWLLVNRTEKGLVLNLSILRAETAEAVAVFLSPEWNPAQGEELCADGVWRRMKPPVRRTDGAYVLPGRFEAVIPRIMRFAKK